MSIFDALKRPKWQHKNPDIRRKAIAQLPDQNQLLEVLKTDPDPLLRASALAKITDQSILDALIDAGTLTLSPPLRQQAIDQRLGQLLPDHPEPVAASLESITDEASLIRIASLSENTALVTAAVAQIKDPFVLKDLASNHKLTKIRLLAAKNIHDIELLQALMHASRGHDKAVYRHCKTQLDEYQAEQQRQTELREKILRVIDASQQLSMSANGPEYRGRYLQLEQQWSTLENSANQQQQAQFRNNLAICSERLSAIVEDQNMEQQALYEQASAKLDCQNLVTELETLDQSTILSGATDEGSNLESRLKNIEERWQAASKICPAPQEIARDFSARLERWRSMTRTLGELKEQKPRLERVLSEVKNLDRSDYQALHNHIKAMRQVLSLLPWPDSQRTILPAQLRQTEQAIKQVNAHIESLSNNQGQMAAQINSALKDMSTALDQNASKPANQAHNKIKQSLKSLPPEAQKNVHDQLRPLIERLNEIQDWQKFAIEPKRVELSARMAALTNFDGDTDTLALRIKALQDEWKHLGPLAHGAREQQLWKEFKAAADEAWRPCQRAFTEQAELRQTNFDRRMELVRQLRDYENNIAWPDSKAHCEADNSSAALASSELAASNELDSTMPSENIASKNEMYGSEPDWPLVKKTLDAAREAFKNFQPVDREGERKSQKALRKICDRIYSHVETEYQRNISDKEQLVSAAQKLLHEDIQSAVDQAKDLQWRWKEIGMTPVKVDRKLWKTFREACDDIFARRDEQNNQRQNEINSQLKQAEALRDQARALLRSNDDQQRLLLKKHIGDLTQAFEDIELPSAPQQSLRKAFQEIKKEADHLDAKTHKQRELSRWNLLGEKIQACALKNTDQAGAISIWQQQGELPKGINTDTLEAFWQQGSAPTNDKQLREACIALEIFGELESPAEDKAARMAYQMQSLVNAKGKSSGKKSAITTTGNQAPQRSTLQNHINAFIGLRPASDWAARFCSSLAKIKV